MFTGSPLPPLPAQLHPRHRGRSTAASAPGSVVDGEQPDGNAVMFLKEAGGVWLCIGIKSPNLMARVSTGSDRYGMDHRRQGPRNSEK
jgi:hypothetical protein